MIVRDPEILSPRTDTSRLVRCETWCERRLDEFVLQNRLPAWKDPATGRTWIDARAWDDWNRDLVEYFIRNGYKGREIDDFIRAHALAGT